MDTKRFNSYVPSKDLVSVYGEVLLSCGREIKVTDRSIERLEVHADEEGEEGARAFSSSYADYVEVIEELRALLEASATTPRLLRLTREELAKELIADVSKEALSEVVSIAVCIRTKAIRFIVANFPKALAAEYIKEAEHMEGIEYWIRSFFSRSDRTLAKSSLREDVQAYVDVAEELKLTDNAS